MEQDPCELSGRTETGSDETGGGSHQPDTEVTADGPLNPPEHCVLYKVMPIWTLASQI